MRKKVASLFSYIFYSLLASLAWFFLFWLLFSSWIRLVFLFYPTLLRLLFSQNCRLYKTVLHSQNSVRYASDCFSYLAAILLSNTSPWSNQAYFQIILYKVAFNHLTNPYFFYMKCSKYRKNFFYNVLYYYYKLKEENVICIASSVIASFILPSKQTSNFQFKISFNIHKNFSCYISKNSKSADLCSETTLFLWNRISIEY